MPGAGKTQAATYLVQKNIPFVRFGEVTDEGLRDLGLPYTPENERMYREKIRQELGMAAYAIRSKSKIENLLKENNVIAIDGLYSWEEYVFLKKEFPNLTLIHIFAEPKIRYQRLAARRIRPVSVEKGYDRDVTEIENLNKGGPIAIADFCIINNGDIFDNLYKQIDEVLFKLGVNKS